ncbi:MAG: hypothetical protein NDJ89_17580 [Oligoflexia bacterium]|nr:hypothetical protein [Oligoflexia bacterium]
MTMVQRLEVEFVDDRLTSLLNEQLPDSAHVFLEQAGGGPFRESKPNLMIAPLDSQAHQFH